jgi:hypothetical protein
LLADRLPAPPAAPAAEDPEEAHKRAEAEEEARRAAQRAHGHMVAGSASTCLPRLACLQQPRARQCPRRPGARPPTSPVPTTPTPRHFGPAPLQVTSELFADWKKKFDAEMALLRAAVKDPAKDERVGRVSGKQWFLQGDGQGGEADAPSEEEEEEEEEGAEGEQGGEQPGRGRAAGLRRRCWRRWAGLRQQGWRRWAGLRQRGWRRRCPAPSCAPGEPLGQPGRACGCAATTCTQRAAGPHPPTHPPPDHGAGPARDSGRAGAAGGAGDEDSGSEDGFEDSDEDDDAMLNEYLATKKI